MSDYKYLLSKQEFTACQQLGALGIGALSKILLKCPAQSSSFFAAILECRISAFGATLGGASLVEVVEAPTTSVDGTPLVPLCRNRLDTPPATTVGVFTNTDATVGTVLTQGNAELGQDFCSGCLILKPATNYLIRVTNQSGAALTNGVINVILRPLPNFDQLYDKSNGRY